MAIQSQEKFQFYLVALAFTILGLSIQTYDDSSLVIASFLEMFAWASLLVSGLAGLSYLEWGPVIQEKLVLQNETEEIASHLKKQEIQGIAEIYVEEHSKIMPIEGRIKECESHIGEIAKIIEGLEKKSLFKYHVFKWSFLTGVVSLVAGRAYTPLVKILGAG